MTEWRSDDLAVVIPTLGRWDVLRRTLDGLGVQSVTGFEVVVVVDGAAEPPPDVLARAHVRVVTQKAAGPGAARNRGVRNTERPLILFLGDDMLPTPELVAAHLDVHRRHPGSEAAVLGRVVWHPEVADNPLNQWLDTSGTQFDYAGIERERAGAEDYDAGFGRFYSCNVSLKRSFLDLAGGFDETFIFYYEDLDLGWRLHDRGLRLLYQPEALVHHLHGYDWAGLVDRFRGIALGERLMTKLRPEFEPFFLRRLTASPSPFPQPWGRWSESVIGLLSARLRPKLEARRPGLADRLERRIDVSYHRRLAQPFLATWEAAAEVEDLREYLGADYQPSLLMRHAAEVDAEAASAPDEETFYRTSQAYLYDLTAFAMSPTKDPYLRQLVRHVPAHGRILDYGCGTGSDGLRLSSQGFDLDFADFDNPSTRYLRWRLDQRGLHCPVYDIDVDQVPVGFDAVMCFDVIEHVPDPVGFLETLESFADVVAVNFLDPAVDDTHLHRPLDIRGLVARAERHGLLHYRVYHQRSHLVIYRTHSPSGWSSTAHALRGRYGHRAAGVLRRR